MATKVSSIKMTKPKKAGKESKAALEQYRKMLTKRKEELAESVKHHVQELPDTGMEGVAGDSSDHAAADYTTEMFGALLERQAGTLEEVEHAIDKLNNKEYGVCEICEKSIPSKRLKALPWARCCLECQEREDRIGALKRSRATLTEWETVEEA